MISESNQLFKIKFRLYAIIISFILLMNCCQSNKTKSLPTHSHITKPIGYFKTLYPNFNKKELKRILKNNVQKDCILNNLYAKNEYKPIWFNDSLKNKPIEQLIRILADCDKHGLDRARFEEKQIDSLYNEIYNKKIYSIKNSYNAMLELETLATKATLKYITGMTYGFVSPEVIFSDLYHIPILQPDQIFIDSTYQNIRINPVKTIENSVPSDSVYLMLEKKYNKLSKLQPDSEIYKIQTNNTFKIGSKSLEIYKIAHRLSLTGEYYFSKKLAKKMQVMTLNWRLMNAINKFRKENSYFIANEIDPYTIAALNRPIQYYIDKIKVNLERRRWKKNLNTNNKYIRINIPAYLLTAFGPDSTPLTMRICGGKANTPTPLLMSDIKYIHLNPTWTIPTSIVENEIIQLETNNPDYLEQHKMIVLKNGQKIDPEEINWETIDPEKDNFIIRQTSGSWNALGKLKFIFNNPYFIFLHDTPNKQAFYKNIRAISHGCIRLQNPIDLMFFCLSPIKQIDKDRILYAINKINKISDTGHQLLLNNQLDKSDDLIKLDIPIPLIIDYETTYMLPNDKTIYFADDIYNLDSEILHALQ